MLGSSCTRDGKWNRAHRGLEDTQELGEILQDADLHLIKILPIEYQTCLRIYHDIQTPHRQRCVLVGAQAPSRVRPQIMIR